MADLTTWTQAAQTLIENQLYLRERPVTVYIRVRAPRPGKRPRSITTPVLLDEHTAHFGKPTAKKESNRGRRVILLPYTTKLAQYLVQRYDEQRKRA